MNSLKSLTIILILLVSGCATYSQSVCLPTPVPKQQWEVFTTQDLIDSGMSVEFAQRLKLQTELMKNYHQDLQDVIESTCKK